MWTTVLFGALWFSSLTFADISNPYRDPNVCGIPTCGIDNPKFKYGPSSRQIYKYSVNVQSAFNGTSKNESTLSFESTVVLEFLTDCEGIITLKDSKLSEGGFFHPRSSDFDKSLSAFAVRFSFYDGLITEICPNAAEEVWVLNLKKGLISLFQNTMERFDLDSKSLEEDVKGKCLTTYEVVGTERTTLFIDKTKDLASCTRRSKLHSVIQSVPYSFRSKIQPEESLLKSLSKCTFSIDHNIYKSIKCTESHLVRPFSNRDSGVTTNIYQKLILDREENSTTIVKTEEIKKRVPLLFDHTPSTALVTDNIQKSRSLIQKMCDMDTEDDHTRFSVIFTDLVASLRILRPQALTEIYDHSAILCPTGRKNVIDALPYVESTGSLVIMMDLIKKQAVSTSTINDWFFYLSLTRHPDEKVIAAAADLLTTTPFNSSLTLSIGTLTHTFCAQHSDCGSVPAIQRITEFLEKSTQELYKTDTKNRNNHDQLVVFLKALGNSGELSPNFKQNLVEIIENPDLTTDIRIAAIECFRKIPCDTSRDFFEKLYRDQDQDSEIRIAAYLQIMKCPNYLLIRNIRHTLENEEVNQVGSFVWSHLNNLLKSAVPSRVEIQGLLSDTDLIKKFSQDFRKFSRNFESSIFFEEYNIGGNYDSNLIFSTKSYFPTSMTMNFTLDMFGNSINLFEVSARAEGFEKYLESLFGSNGPWSRSKFEESLPKMRFSRNAESESLRNQLQYIPNVMQNNFDDPKVAISLRLFGNDLKYIAYHGHEELKQAIDSLKPMNFMEHILSRKEINYHKAMMFLDTSYEIPTGAGLPMSLAAIGTSSLSVKFLGNLEADNFAKTRELELKADAKPTASLDITTSMCVDAFYAKVGLKVKTSMYSSTAIGGHIKLNGYKLASVKVTLPQEKSEIFNSRSELLVLKHDKEEKQFGLKEYMISRSLCSWPHLEKTIGLRSCVEYHFVNVTKMRNAPYFALAGPAGFRIFLEKINPKAKDFIFEYSWTDKQEGSAVSLVFDVPGASIGRIIDANVTIDNQSKNLTLLVTSTAGIVLVRGKYKNTIDEKFLQVAVNINELKYFDTNVALSRKPTNHGFIYYPKFSLGVHDEKVIDVQGSVKLISRKDVSQYDVDMKFQTKRVTTKLFGYISRTQSTLATKLRMLYKFPKAKEQGIDLSFSFANRAKRNLLDIQGTASLQSSAYPQFDFDSNLNVLRGHAHTEGMFNITFNPKAEPVGRTNFALKIIDKSLDEGTKIFHTIVILTKPSKNIDINADFQYQSKHPNTNIALVVDYGKDKRFSTTVFLFHNTKPLQDFKLQLNVSVPTFHPMLATFILHEKLHSLYNVEFNGTWFSGHSMLARGIYQDRSTSASYDHHAKLLLKSPSFQDVSCNLQYYRDANELKINLRFAQNNSDYMILLKHNNESPEDSKTLAKIKYQDKIYSWLTTVHSSDHQHVSMEFHIDQLREIHFAAWAHNKEAYKACGIELKWDANRDPNQKLVISGNFTKVGPFNYVANLLGSYPGRTLLGNYEFVLKKGHLYTLVRLSWDDEQSLALILKSDYNFEKKMYVITTSEIVTPFKNWKQTFIDVGFEHEMNMYSMKGSLQWENSQHVSLDFFANYTAIDDYLDCRYKSELLSTLPKIPSLSASVSHTQNNSVMDTLLRLQYAPEDVIDIRSKWDILSDDKTTNYTGTVVAITPFPGFNKGFLISKVMVTKERYLRGVMDLDFDFKKFSISTEGRFKRLSNTMFTVNITTPVEKYSTINGRFGFVEEQRYLVAMVTYPGKILGVEALLSVQSLTEFDTKFILGTPLEVLQRVILIGKLKPDNADFRVGWNPLLGGFKGRWHYVNAADFEYSFIVYTPIESFEENSVILKILMKEGVDAEASVKLSGQKLGAKVFGENKPSLLRELGVKVEEIYSKKLSNIQWKSRGKENENDHILSWSGLVELDTLVYPTIKGTLDVEQKGPIYTIKSKLTAPDGIIVINDRFEFYDALCIRNKLQITTPYTTYSVIDSNFVLDISPSRTYIFSINVNYKNESEFIKNDFAVKYILLNETGNSKTHNATVHIETPIVTFLNVDGGVVLKIKKSSNLAEYGSNLYLLTKSIDFATSGNLKLNATILNADVFLRAKTSALLIPPSYLTYNREMKPAENIMEVHLSIPEKYEKDIQFRTNWYVQSLNNFNAYIDVQTPFDGFEKSELGLRLSTYKDELKSNILVNISPVDAKLDSTFKDDLLQSQGRFNISGKGYPVLLKCNIIKSTPSSRKVNGTLMIENVKYYIKGNIDLVNRAPMGMHIDIVSQDNNNVANFDYKISNENNIYKIIGSINKEKEYIKLNADTSIRSVNDWDTKTTIETSHQRYKLFKIIGNCKNENLIKTLKIDAETPFKTFENIKLITSLRNASEGSQLDVNFDSVARRGNITFNWIWIYLENMKINLVSDLYFDGKGSTARIKGLFVNPNRDFKYLTAGGDVNFNEKWISGSNLTLALPSIDNITIDANLRLPPPAVEIHVVKGKLFYTTPIDQLEYLAKYNGLISKKNYASNGTLKITKKGDNNHIDGNLAVQWAANKILNNIFTIQELYDGYDIIYKLATAKYKNKKAIVFKGTYTGSDLHHNLTCQLFKPEDNSIALGKINFKELANMNGLVNITIPYETMNYAGVNFSTETTARKYNRYLEAFWPKNSAIIDAKCDIITGQSLLHRTRKGNVVIEIPIASKHRANIDYIYKESPLHSVGNASVDYNGNRILDGKYDCQTESRAGFEKDTTHVELLNSLLPLGTDYVHGFEYGVPSAQGNVPPSKDTKHVKLYHLTNRTKFAIEGELSLGATATGQQLELHVKHLNKTVKIKSGYDVYDQEYKQRSRIELDPKIWIAYDISLKNETVNEDFDAQRFQLDVQYPVRNFTAIGYYNIGQEFISTNIGLTWDVDNKYVDAGLDWKKVSERHEQLLLTLRHPTFKKNVTVLSEYEYDNVRIIDARMKIDYSEDPDHIFQMGACLNDYSGHELYNYTYYIFANHSATNLDLQGKGDFYWSPVLCTTNHGKEYKRSYLPSQPSEAFLTVDLDNNLVELKRDTMGQLSYLKAMYSSENPIYRGNLSTIYDFNEAGGDYYLNVDDKIFRLDYNMTTDARQSMHMYGDIPDARSAKFNAWRDYEDIRINDVKYYLNMNHSRLIISNLVWRANLLRGLQSGLHDSLHLAYNFVIESINDTRHYARSEIKEAVAGIWTEAEPVLQNYIDDLRGLRIIEDDIENLKVFLNKTYHADDFYLKTLVTVTMFAFDELALKKHFESVPAIISEIWGIMGDSGKRIQKSIEWVLEKIKTYYKNITVFMRQLLDGDPIDKLSITFSNMLEQYDDFIRKMHVAFIQYIEKLWNQTYDLIVDNWYKMLIAIEPTFLKLVAYVESIAWSTSQEFLDFLYVQKNEIMVSPYFAKFTNFTHDVDVFYREITGNNTISSVVKYTKIGWKFLKDRYMDKLPFAEEVHNILEGILEDLNKLRMHSSIAYLEQRFNQIYSRVAWFYEYFDVETRIQYFVTLMHKKMTDYSQTALEAENRYREAKTKFIFDPNSGEMLLEQKLPMSWHAFNETPNFQEIPEIKAFYDIQDFFTTSHRNFWKFYYDYKPFTDPSEWLPPYKAQAVIIGNRHYVTFDKKFYEFKGECSYLLSSDMKDHRWSLVVSYIPKTDKHELALIINKTVIQIDIFSEVVRIGDSAHSQLPTTIGDTFIHRDSDIISIDSASGFNLECNTKFRVCTFEVSGWYFGKTAGLLGTINNEPSDDFLSSTKRKHKIDDLQDFVKSWALNAECAKSEKSLAPTQKTKDQDLIQMCEDIFSSKLSDFSSCFERISNLPFLELCLQSNSLDDVCSVASAYTTLCNYENTPLRMPDSCIRCSMPNGTFIKEGEFVRFTEHNISQSADVIFLVETKDCNKNFTKSKNMKFLIDSLEDEFIAFSTINNRYAVVLYGGDGVFSEPKVRSLNGEIFLNASTVSKAMENIPVGNGSADIFTALIYATKLHFRPTASKIFILIPCTKCFEGTSKFDYSILHHVLSENVISLHILMNEDFNLQKTRENKIPYGIDNKKAYTKKDFRILKGDEVLRNHIKLPKMSMGLCMPLALETNGTLFASKYLRNGKDDSTKKFASIFTKRVAEGSNAGSCMDCECTAPNSGVSYTECYPCHFPSRASLDYGFDEDALLMNLQPGESMI